MDFIIRPLKESDMVHLNQLFIETVHTINAADYSQEQLDAWAPKKRAAIYWNARLKDHITYVADAQGVIVGFADITKDGNVDHVYVHKNFQGKGIARALVHQLEDDACRLGLSVLRTEVSITAKPFFQKIGFMVICKQDKIHNGLIFTTYCMHKNLID
jgi:putative acetyltransferase